MRERGELDRREGREVFIQEEEVAGSEKNPRSVLVEAVDHCWVFSTQYCIEVMVIAERQQLLL